MALLALVAALILYSGLSSLAEAYNGPGPGGGEDENPLQTGVLVIAGLVPVAVSIAAGRAARIVGGRLRRHRPS